MCSNFFVEFRNKNFIEIEIKHCVKASNKPFFIVKVL